MKRRLKRVLGFVVVFSMIFSPSVGFTPVLAKTEGSEDVITKNENKVEENTTKETTNETTETTVVTLVVENNVMTRVENIITADID